MMTFPTFKTLQAISPKMAQFPIAASAQKQISEVTPKGHTLVDSFDRVGAGENRGLNLSDFTRMGRTIGTNIDGESGRQGANAKTGIESVGAGFPSSKDILGSLEPGADLASGVENGSVDKQGNASSVPSFGVDSRLAADRDGVDLAWACFWGAAGGAVERARARAKGGERYTHPWKC